MSCSSAAYSSHSRSRSPRPCSVARLIEERQRQPRDLPRVLGLPVAALGELDGRAAAHVGIAIDARDVLAVLLDVVEHQPFAQRQVAQRDLLGVELAQQRVEQHRAGDHEIGAARIEPGQLAGARARSSSVTSFPQPADALGRTRAGCAISLGHRAAFERAWRPCRATGWCPTCR